MTHTHALTDTLTHTYTHAHTDTHAHAHTHTHTPIHTHWITTCWLSLILPLGRVCVQQIFIPVVLTRSILCGCGIDRSIRFCVFVVLTRSILCGCGIDPVHPVLCGCGIDPVHPVWLWYWPGPSGSVCLWYWPGPSCSVWLWYWPSPSCSVWLWYWPGPSCVAVVLTRSILCGCGIDPVRSPVPVHISASSIKPGVLPGSISLVQKSYWTQVPAL